MTIKSERKKMQVDEIANKINFKNYLKQKKNNNKK